MLEIEAPEQAVAVWLIADQIYVRFPDRQLITIPASQIGRLATILHSRERYALEGRKGTVGTCAAPVQYDIDAISEAMARQTKLVNEAGAERRLKDAETLEREKRRLFRRDAKRRAAKEAEEFLAQIGL